MRFTTIVLMGLLTMTVVNAETTAEERYITELEASEVQFIYSNEGRVTIIKTADTAEAVDELVSKAPIGLDVTIVEYVSHGRAGTELKYREEE